MGIISIKLIKIKRSGEKMIQQKKDTTATQQETAHYQHPLLNPSTYFKQ